MARLSNDPITATDLDQYLSTQDSFALELRVLRHAIALQYQAEHGGSYVDPSSSKHRQFDLRATKQRGVNAIALAIECKSLQANYPLLVSRIPRAANESYQRYAFLNSVGFSIFPAIAESGHDRSIYRPAEMVGKSLAQVGKVANGGWTDSDSDVYEKWSQALNSSIELYKVGLQHRVDLIYTAVIPCLVVSDGTLWTVDYQFDGAVARGPAQVDEATLFVGRTFSVKEPIVSEVKISHLHIFTESGIKTRLQEIHDGTAWWGDMFP